MTRALPYFEKAIALGPNEPLARSNLSLAFFQLGDFSQARDHGFEAVKLKPRLSLYAGRLGLVLWNTGDLVQAGEYFREAEQRRFVNSEIYYHLWFLALQEVPSLEFGDPKEGVVWLEKALQLEPGWTVAARTLPCVLETFPDPTIRDGVRAVTLAEQVCAQGGYRDVEAIDTLGAAYAAAGRFDEAIRVAEIAVKIASAQVRLEFADRVQRRLALYQAGKPHDDIVKEKLAF